MSEQTKVGLRLAPCGEVWWSRPGEGGPECWQVDLEMCGTMETYSAP